MSFYSESNFFPDRSVGYLIKRNFRLCEDALAPAFVEEGLTFTQWQALISIYFGRATTGAELANDLAHDKGATIRTIDTLEERGWITRERDLADRRCVNLALTEAGVATALRVRQRLIACWNVWLTDWNSADVETLIDLLQRLEVTLSKAASEPPCG
ncbi:MAG: MarR family winged helix-turn-helix transcriptional regulator [Pseudomonadota bacterium]